MWKSKDRHAVGQRMHTRSLQLLADVDDKVRDTAGAYRRTYSALETLSIPLVETKWHYSLKPLEESDVVGLTSMDNAASEGRKRLSWIWKVHGTGADADECTQEGVVYVTCIGVVF